MMLVGLANDLGQISRRVKLTHACPESTLMKGRLRKEIKLLKYDEIGEWCVTECAI